MDSYNRGAAGPPKPGRALSPSSPPPLPRAGRGNQSWLTGPLSGWSYDTCQVKKVTAIDEWYHSWYQDGIRVVPGGIRVVPGWYQTGTWYRFILDI